jgi:hypothetical protein
MMNSFYFWQRWLFYTSILFALVGIAFALYGNNPLFILYNNTLAEIFWQQPKIPAETDLFRAHIWGALGGTMACCYILLSFIAHYPFRNKEKWAWWAIVISFSAWVVIDSSVSIYYGVYFQVYIINAFSILVKALPLIFTYKNFFNNKLTSK